MKRAGPAAALALGLVAFAYGAGRDQPPEQRQEESAAGAALEAARSPEPERAHSARPDPNGTVRASTSPLPASLATGGELARREQLQAEARLLDLAQELLEARDQGRLVLLLAYSRAGSALAPSDALALTVALDCLQGDEGREGAERFLREAHSSRLRKQVRRVCFTQAPRAGD